MLGRPTDYKQEYDSQVTEWLAEGKTLADFAELIDVTYVTIWNWEQNHESFFNAIKKGREIAQKIYTEKFLKSAIRDDKIQPVPFVMYCRNVLRLKTKDDTPPPPPPTDGFNYGEAIADDN